MAMVKNKLREWHDQAGFRGRFLGLLSGMTTLYGIGLLIAHRDNAAHWWPGSLPSLGFLPIWFWGLVWVAIGIFLGTGVFKKRNRLYYLVAASLAALWSYFVVTWWWVHRGDTDAGAWAIGVVWIGIATGVYLISDWPEPNERG